MTLCSPVILVDNVLDEDLRQRLLERHAAQVT